MQESQGPITGRQLWVWTGAGWKAPSTQLAHPGLWSFSNCRNQGAPTGLSASPNVCQLLPWARQAQLAGPSCPDHVCPAASSRTPWVPPSPAPRHPGWASGLLCVPEPSPPVQLWFFMTSAHCSFPCHIFKDSAPASPCPPAQRQASSLAAPPLAVTPDPASLTVATRSPCTPSRPKSQCPVLSMPSQ